MNPQKQLYPLTVIAQGWAVVIGRPSGAFVAYSDTKGYQTTVKGARLFKTRKEARAFKRELRAHVSGPVHVCRAQAALQVDFRVYG